MERDKVKALRADLHNGQEKTNASIRIKHVMINSKYFSKWKDKESQRKLIYDNGRTFRRERKAREWKH